MKDDRMGRPGEGNWHVVKDSQGNNEIVTDEEIEAATHWFEDYRREARQAQVDDLGSHNDV